jgi:MFS transporter, DHA2 family, multidrug resistance protein
VNAGPRAARAGRREWIALGVLTLPCLLYAMDLTVLNLAVPAISKSLRPSGFELLWIVDIYGFVLAGSLITMGALGDRIGRRRLLLAGTARQAFGYGMHVAFAICAVLTLAAAVAAVTLLRHLRTAEPEFQPEPGQVAGQA